MISTSPSTSTARTTKGKVQRDGYQHQYLKSNSEHSPISRSLSRADLSSTRTDFDHAFLVDRTEDCSSVCDVRVEWPVVSDGGLGGAVFTDALWRSRPALCFVVSLSLSSPSPPSLPPVAVGLLALINFSDYCTTTVPPPPPTPTPTHLPPSPTRSSPTRPPSFHSLLISTSISVRVLFL